MSQRNVEIVRTWLNEAAQALNSGDSRAFSGSADRFMTEDVVYEEDPVWPDAGTFRGRAAMVARFLEYRDLMQLRRIDPEKVTTAGDLVLARVRIEMLGAHGGEPLEFVWTYSLRMEEGRITHFRAWYDPDDAARAAGLSE
jgi:ketosteroid isomerase-like protein